MKEMEDMPRATLTQGRVIKCVPKGSPGRVFIMPFKIFFTGAAFIFCLSNPVLRLYPES